MSLQDLYNATFLVKVFQGTKRSGADLPKVDGDTGSCRLQPSDGKTLVNRDGEDILIDAIVWVDPDVVVTEKDDIEVNGILYRIIDKIAVSDSGTDHHIRLRVRKR